MQYFDHFQLLDRAYQSHFLVDLTILCSPRLVPVLVHMQFCQNTRSFEVIKCYYDMFCTVNQKIF